MSCRKGCQKGGEMRTKNLVIGIILFVLFLCALYIVELGQYGSKEVAKYNAGYGTFDMKHYDSDTVKTVLGKMTPEGIQVYKKYYLMDSIFILFFGLFQCYISYNIYGFLKGNPFQFLSCFLPVVRAICDIVENSLLYQTLCAYPIVNETCIKVANTFTTCKLWTIRLWIAELLIGVVLGIILRRR